MSSTFDFTGCRNNSCADKLLKTLMASEKQYPPLKREDEDRMRADYLMAGKEKELRNLLAMHHIRYCYSLTRKYSRTTVDFDEMIGRAIEGLFIAADKFDFKKPVRFITYAQPYIFRGIMHEYYDKTQQAINSGVSMDRPILDSEEDGGTMSNLVDGLADKNFANDSKSLGGEDAPVANECHSIYKQILLFVLDSDKFTNEERYVFLRAVIEKKSMKTLAEVLGVPYHVVNKMKSAIIDKLKGFLSETFHVRNFVDIL